MMGAMYSTPLTPDQRADRVASRQYALITHGDAMACGLSDRQIDQRVRAGRWQRLMRGLYRVAAAPGSWRQDALVGCLAAPAGGLASHLTAAALWGWSAPSLLPHITVPPPASSRTPLAKLHRSLVPGADRTHRDGIPCTSPSRTLVDCASLVERTRLESMVDDALCAELAAPESVLATLGRAGRRGRRGATVLTAVLQVWIEAIEPGSPAEVRFLRRLAEWGCAGAVTQHEVRDLDGRFVARLDVALPEQCHGFEYDSDRYHNPRRWEADEARHARLRALGWRIDHVSKRDLLPSAGRIPALLAGQVAA
ncbi:type IV toxin-antitoxin system AbiEi family antitoxin domain-containing protein [soil metagenome]